MEKGRIFSFTGIIFAIISLIAIPIIFGPIAIIFGLIARKFGDHKFGLYVIKLGFIFMIISIILGILISIWLNVPKPLYKYGLIGV